MKKALVSILKYALFLGLGIYIIFHMSNQLTADQKSKLYDAIKNVSVGYLFIIAIVGVLSHYVRALRWRYLLETINLKPSKMNTMFAVMIGYLTNMALPRAGEVAKCTVLAKYEKLPAHKMVGTIVAERAFDVFSLFVIAVATFLIEMSRINAYVSNLVHKFLHGKELILLAIPFVILAVVLLLIRMYKRNPDSKASQLMKEMTHGILSIFHMKKKWEFLGLTIIMWLMYAAQIYLGLLSLANTQSLSFMASMVVLVYGSLALIVTPGGIGAYPLLVAQILEGPYGVDQVTALAFGWVAWALQTIVILIFGLISLLVIQPYNSRKNGQTSVDTA